VNEVGGGEIPTRFFHCELFFVCAAAQGRIRGRHQDRLDASFAEALEEAKDLPLSTAHFPPAIKVNNPHLRQPSGCH
jgi:hypothetical protein